MYKRALLLTAATVALLSGPAYAANTTEPITKKVTTKLTTSGTNIDVTTATNSTGNTTSTGSIQIPSSSTDSATPAVEINSNNTVTLASTTELTFNGTTDAVGIQADSGYKGEIINGGTIELTGDGTDKTGILIGVPSGTVGTFTGIKDTTNDPVSTALPFSPYNPTGLTAIALQSGSVLEVQGDGSTGIQLTTEDKLVGDIIDAGSITATATSLTATAATDAVTGIDLQTLSTMDGNLSIPAGGSVISTGAGARGIVANGQLNGSITNFGEISAIGTSTPSTTKVNPEAGSALVIGGNVTGGIYNGGPGNGDTETARATITTTGTSPALDITPEFDSAIAAPITIGGYTDPLKVFGDVSLLNRGTISASPTSVDNDATAAAINGVSSTDEVTFTNGIVNAGSISAGVTTDSKSVAGTSEATALAIGDFVQVNQNTDATTGFGKGYALVNSSESGEGSITASISGDGPGTASAIIIGQSTTTSGTNGGTTLTSLFNSGTISASAETTDTTIASLSAYGIADTTGTLTTITNSGTISATSTLLDNRANIADAIDLSNATTATTITNTGTISGDVELGSGQDTITVSGSPAVPSTLSGNIFFGGSANNVLEVDGGGQVIGKSAGATVTGNVLETPSGRVAVTVENGGTLTVTNNGYAENGTTALETSTGTLTTGAEPGLRVSTLTVMNAGTLGLTLAQPFNLNLVDNDGPVVTSTGAINIDASSIVNLSFGSFVSSTDADPAKFIVFDAPTGDLHIADGASIATSVDSNVPFLFTGSPCTVNAPTPGIAACTTPPETTTDSQLALELKPKTSQEIGLTGYAATLFPDVNKALAVDSALGSAVIDAGLNLPGATSAKVDAAGQKVYQGIYSAFAPDVTGASRALAISLTDEATGPVGARQRALRMYAGQDSDLTIWGQEFAQRLNIGSSDERTGYDNTGFGFSMGADSGDPHDGRFGGAFTFYSGNTSEKEPRTSKTSSEWFLGTAYSDWRGKGLFVDAQGTVGYGQLTGKRSLIIDGTTEADAQGKRASELLAGGVTTGVIMHTGGTVFMPQLSLDGLTLREEGYTENNSAALTTAATDGFDLHVKPYYANSLRAFAGADLRQDLNFGTFFLQPELRGGYRYDFIDGAEKLKAEFACSTVTDGCGATSFSLTGPDPARANLVAGGGVAVTTGAWSIGLNYDYLRGIGGTKGQNQTATLTLLGRI